MEKGPANFNRAQAVEQLRKLGLEHPESKKLCGQYFEFISSTAEKITGRGNVVVYIEMAKLYHDAGFHQEAEDLLVKGEEGIFYEARQLGFTDLCDSILELVEGWEK